MKTMKKKCECESYTCEIEIAKTGNTVESWVIVSFMKKIVFAMRSFFWGGKHCEVREEYENSKL
jgi:hypothetical protein